MTWHWSRTRESWLFKTFTKFELPPFKGQILQLLLHCNTRMGGWEFPQDSFNFFCIFLFDNTITFCIIELFANMSNCMCCTTWKFCVIASFALQEFVPYLRFLLSNDIQQQMFDFDCPISWKFNHLSSCFTSKHI